MRRLDYTIPGDCAGMDVKRFARTRLGLSSRTFVQQKHLDGGMLLNGTACRSVDILSAGDILTFQLPEEQNNYPAVRSTLSILFENDDYLMVDKAPGMPVHPSPGHDRDSLLNAAAYHYEQTGQSHLFRPLYRLDKDTSGILAVGKSRAAVSGASIEKIYYAVCEGVLTGSGVIDVPIGLSEGSKIVRECGHGERAVTHWRALADDGEYTCLAVQLETGRTHQIRAHFSYLGHPLAGDDLYGGSRDKILRQALHCGRVFLSCRALALEQEFRSAFPPDIQAAFPWLPVHLETS